MKFHFWNTFFIIFFVTVAVFGYQWLSDNGRLVGAPPLLDFFLMALAVMRLVRLFTYDVITKFIRDWFEGRDPRTFLGTLGTLINCPWCTGLWFSMLMVIAYFATPVAWYAIFVLALASLASTFQLLSNLIGWHAEYKKKQVQEM